eukprot:GILK01002403.1.p1 GENE.GILK01002403.1~~GILK01002403.1.p1  ORF type:complete len:1329 (-),score=303.46 GILK01002403.1:72-3644(-)
MEQANKLISGLAGEKKRWTQDSQRFADEKARLVGDCGVACAFVSYVGPFNQTFRTHLVKSKIYPDLNEKKIPVTDNLDITRFLVDDGTIGEWNLQGLPTDDLSIQNGILVTRSSRFPLLIDPQGQALAWIKKRESQFMPYFGTTTLASGKFRDYLEFTMAEGKPLIIEGIEQDVDPILDPVLEKQIISKGKSKFIRVADTNMDFSDEFRLYMTSRRANPRFSPELSAKVTIIDFAVTQEGLEQQLLGRVLKKEQRSLEEQLAQLLEEVTANTKALQALDRMLLERLSATQGNLLDDTELIEVLANTKAKAQEVEIKLANAAEKKEEINKKREQYRPVATRGSVLYFVIVEMSLVEWMYNTALSQFLKLYDVAVDTAEKTTLTNKRVTFIVDRLMYVVYRYMNRGLFEKDKRTYLLMNAFKILITDSTLSRDDVNLFLRGGTALDERSERKNPFPWLSDRVWLNVIQLSRDNQLFRDLPEVVARNESVWKRWYDENSPEIRAVPDYEEMLANDLKKGSFNRLLLVRSLREDRMVIATDSFIKDHLGEKYVQPVSDSIEDVWAESDCRTPVLFLLSAGADPTQSIDELAKKKKKFPTDKVSMGEGQEPVALEKIKNGFMGGSWVVLQNCHLGLSFMNQLEDLLTKTESTESNKGIDVDPDFRLWITSVPTPEFPIGLLQMSIKVTNEPPKGIKAGLHRTYTTVINQDFVDKIDSSIWRKLTFTVCYLHSVVQERRKFGPLGWCVPYEFNQSDLESSLAFIERHLWSALMRNEQISWPTVRYMVSEVLYGGRITDDMDRVLFNTFSDAWMNDKIFHSNFSFTAVAGSSSLDFKIGIPDGTELSTYRDYVSNFPAVDSPEVFGLHANADLTFRSKEAQDVLTTIQNTQPKDATSSSGKSREEIVREKALELSAKLPEDYKPETYREQIRKLKGPTGDKGFNIPLNIFLYQEVQRIQNVISIVRKTLQDLVDAIDGLIIMTPDLLAALNAIYDARVPHKWLFDPTGAEISWILPTLGLWFTGLLDRSAQITNWLSSGRPNSFWLTGFFNPQGFLTAMRQEVTRQHKADQWALDDVIFSTEVRDLDKERVRQPPAEGVYIHGLYLDGCKWNRQEGRLDESEAKKLYSPMPIIHVSAVSKNEKKGGKNEAAGGPYECPVYKYPRRTDKYLVFKVNLKTDVHPMHWTLRGVSLLCSTD